MFTNNTYAGQETETAPEPASYIYVTEKVP